MFGILVNLFRKYLLNAGFISTAIILSLSWEIWSTYDGYRKFNAFATSTISLMQRCDVENLDDAKFDICLGNVNNYLNTVKNEQGFLSPLRCLAGYISAFLIEYSFIGWDFNMNLNSYNSGFNETSTQNHKIRRNKMYELVLHIQELKPIQFCY